MSNTISRFFAYEVELTKLQLENNEGITSYACFEGGGLKFVFHYKTHLLTSFKSLLNQIKLFSAKFKSWTMGNKEVSSANNFGLEVKPFDKPVI